jgi:hypothetical protein
VRGEALLRLRPVRCGTEFGQFGFEAVGAQSLPAAPARRRVSAGTSNEDLRGPLDIITYPSDPVIAPGNRFALAVNVTPAQHVHFYAPGTEDTGR